MKNVSKTAKLDTLKEAVRDDLRSFSSNRACARLLDRFSKKFEIDDDSLNVNAFKLFEGINELWATKSIASGISDNSDVIANARFFIERYLWRANNRLASREAVEIAPQTTFDLQLVLRFWRYGPGASNGVKGKHPCQKLDQPFTCTERAAPFVRLLSRSIPHYTPTFGKCFVEVVDATKLIAVPKNDKTARLIGIEPSGNMALQLAFASIVEEALAIAGFDIRTPSFQEGTLEDLRSYALNQSSVCEYPQAEWNKNMARLGSITGDFSTLDLSSASDHISPALIAALWPRDCVHFMNIIRAQKFDCSKFGDSFIDSNIFSTMGNGFTFPIMTMTFLALYYGYLCSLGMVSSVGVDPERFCVFGDDMIVPTEHFQGFYCCLSELGLVINQDKSFSDGFFRESCGGDFYFGKDITPFYIKSVSTEADIYVAINQATRWSAERCVPLPNLLSTLVGMLESEGKKPLVVPFWHSDDAGIKSSRCPKRYHFLKPVLRRKVYKGASPMLAILGGYVSPSNDGTKLLFTPSTSKVSYCVESARIPKGYLDGACYLLMTRIEIDWVDDLLSPILSAPKGG